MFLILTCCGFIIAIKQWINKQLLFLILFFNDIFSITIYPSYTLLIVFVFLQLAYFT